MSYKTHARHGSATMPHGITAERSRVDLNAFVIVCFVWRAPPMLKPVAQVGGAGTPGDRCLS